MDRAPWFVLMATMALGVSGQTAPPPQHGAYVPVPVLIEDRSGEIVFGLSADNFSIRDEGVAQRVTLEAAAETTPLSLLLLIQTGHNAAAQLMKISRLDDLLDSILTNPLDQVGIITFDGTPRLVQDFTADPNPVSSQLASIAGGNERAALFDALHLAMRTFTKAPSENRRVILLISGEHDHGSNAFDTASLIQAISSSDASIYGLSFSTTKNDLMGHIWSLNPLAMTASAMQKNAPQALAQLTGGDYYRFNSEKSFEDRVTEIANHIHNRYILTFHPSDRQPGFHFLQVDLQGTKASIVTARSGYWMSTTNRSDDAGGAQ
jgi:VWFA-related protein